MKSINMNLKSNKNKGTNIDFEGNQPNYFLNEKNVNIENRAGL